MTLWWILFTLFILAMLALDLGVFNRKAHVISFKEALLWTSFWVSLALLFGVGVYYFYGHHKTLEYFTGYLIEYSLSVDNLFVFLLIFQHFRVPHKLEHKVLFWGILLALINKFHWIIYIFGAFLIYTAVRMAMGKGREIHPGKNILVRLLRKIMPVTRNYQEGRFFVVKRGVRFATPLFAVILALETTDIIFAVDSIPAILAITKDPFIIYILAITKDPFYHLCFHCLCHSGIKIALFRHFRHHEDFSSSAIRAGRGVEFRRRQDAYFRILQNTLQYLSGRYRFGLGHFRYCLAYLAETH